MLRESPDCIIDGYKKKSYEELLKIRNDLIKKIQKFEKYYNKDEDVIQTPSPEDCHSNDLEDLTLLCGVICEKFREKHYGHF